VFIEVTRLNAGDRIDDGTGHLLRLQQFGFGEIEGGERSVEVEMESVAIPRLAIGQSGELLAVTEQKFDLEAGFVVPVEGQRIQVDIGRKKEGIAGLVPIPHVQQDNDP